MITKEHADRMHAALDKILECSDTLYTEMRKLVGFPIGFHPSHDLNNAVSLIRNDLCLAGFENPRKGPRK